MTSSDRPDEPIRPEDAPVEAPASSSPDAAGPVVSESSSRHEKVEGFDRVEDVPLAQEPVEPQKQSRFGLGRRKEKAPAGPPKPASPPKKPSRFRVSILGGFRNPATRPRYILLSGAALLGFALVMIAALGVTSTRWFCAEGCHKVQDDTIAAYEASTHSEISCMACHMPVGATPVEFLFHKAEALGELYLTATNQFELPLNAESHVALEMSSEQCTQCHAMEQRVVTTSEGIIMDHAVHAENNVDCTLCHNRIAHNEEGLTLTLKDPNTGEPNRPHQVFDSMTACFRCHTQNATEGEGEGPTAPGDCGLCHPKDFELKPASHREADFYPERHGDLATAETSRAASITAEAKAASHESEEAGGGHGGDSIGMSLPSVEGINECSTCHSDKFCSDCHGVIMPHPADFKEGHGEVGNKNPKSCVKCHGPADRFCDDCHHGAAMGREVDTSRRWIPQHMDAVSEVGANACFECHNPTYCASCHVKAAVSD